MAHIVCIVKVTDDSVNFTWGEGPAFFDAYELTGALFQEFKEAVVNARERLADLVVDSLRDPEQVPDDAYKLAVAGYEVYQMLFEPGPDQYDQAVKVRKWLESLSKMKKVDSLEMVVDSPWSVPWNIIYDQRPKKDDFQSEDTKVWRPFWGIRYNISGGRRVNPLRRVPVLIDPQVLMVVDPQIRDGLPEEHQQAIVEFGNQDNVTLVDSVDALTEALDTVRPDILYWLSHATPEALVLNDEEIEPRRLRRLLMRSNEGNELGGIAFLNACQTAEQGEASGFFDAFHLAGFTGMVGTQQQTIDTFAAPLGIRFLTEFVNEQKELGQIMRRLRAKVPLGLLYATYCPTELRVMKGVSSDESSLSIRMTPSGGVFLGKGGATLKSKAEVDRRAPLPDKPYPSLGYYRRDDRALFVGRDADVSRFSKLLDDDDTRVVMLHGESGVGKSSFLRAGVIPFLEEECYGYRFLRGGAEEDAALFIRATGDLLSQLGQALQEFCRQEVTFRTPTGEEVNVALRTELREKLGLDVGKLDLGSELAKQPDLLSRILGATADTLPYTPVLIIDQCEEIFTIPDDEDAESIQIAAAALRHCLAHTSDYRIILSLRTEYMGRLSHHLRQGSDQWASVREYLLLDFNYDQLCDAILRPTSRLRIHYAIEIPYDKYQFSYDPGVAEEIARRTMTFSIERRDSILPLLQVICSQLYDRAIAAMDSDEAFVTREDFEAIGGVEGGLRTHVEGLLAEFGNRSDTESMRDLLCRLFLRQPDGSLTTALVEESQLAEQWKGTLAFEAALEKAQTLRLIKTTTTLVGGQSQRQLSLGHDALAKIAAGWHDEKQRRRQAVKTRNTLIGVSAVALVMFVLMLVAWRQTRKATAARDDANASFEEALDTVDDFFVQTSEKLKGIHAGRLRAELIRKASLFFKEYVVESGQHVGTLQTSRQARVHYLFGRSLLEIPAAQRSADDGDSATQFEKAEGLYRQILEKSPEDIESQVGLSNALTELGNVWIDKADDFESPIRERLIAWRNCLDFYLDALSWRTELPRLDDATPDSKPDVNRFRHQLLLADATENLALTYQTRYEMFLHEKAEVKQQEGPEKQGGPEQQEAPKQAEGNEVETLTPKSTLQLAHDSLTKAQDLRRVALEQLIKREGDPELADMVFQVEYHQAEAAYNLGALAEQMRTFYKLEKKAENVEKHRISGLGYYRESLANLKATEVTHAHTLAYQKLRIKSQLGLAGLVNNDDDPEILKQGREEMTLAQKGLDAIKLLEPEWTADRILDLKDIREFYPPE